ncbi:MAG: hypothetical protein JKY15_00755 [Deltaproteobacteria bacterium]|nr:hypothetical protein [Deltaproteobacteria bacterium]
MIFFFSLMIFTLCYQALLNAMASLMHLNSSIFLVAPIVIVAVIFGFRSLGGLFILLCAGILVDSLTGGALGANMLLMVFVGLLSMILSSWLGQPHWPLVFSFLLAVSFVYRILLSQMGNWGFESLIIGPFADALAGVMLFSWVPKRVFKID